MTGTVRDDRQTERVSFRTGHPNAEPNPSPLRHRFALGGRLLAAIDALLAVVDRRS